MRAINLTERIEWRPLAAACTQGWVRETGTRPKLILLAPATRRIVCRVGRPQYRPTRRLSIVLIGFRTAIELWCSPPFGAFTSTWALQRAFTPEVVDASTHPNLARPTNAAVRG